MTKTVLIRQTWILAALIIAGCSGLSYAQDLGTSGSRGASDDAIKRAEREILRLAKGAGGVVGVSAVHMETGRRLSLNGGERFPMASTYKVPIAIELLTRVDKGEVRLDQMINIQTSDIHPGSFQTSDLVINNHGVALSVRNLLELMLLISDNSATDICLRLAGGPEAVTARMRAAGINGITVNRSTIRLIADFSGIV